MLIQSKKNIITGLLAASVSSISAASGFDRGVVPPDFLFEKGDFAQFSFASAMPSVSGKVTASPKATLEASAAQALGIANMLPDGEQKDEVLEQAALASGAAALMPSVGADTGKVAQDYTRTGLSFKQEFNDKVTFGMQLTQPAGLNVQYSDALFGTNIDFKVSSVDALVKYQVTDNVSVFGGPRLQQVSNTTFGTAPKGEFKADATEEVGYQLGLGYKNADYHTQLMVSYTSKIDSKLPATQLEIGAEGTDYSNTADLTFNVSTPEQMQLALKQPLSQNSMLVASYRKAMWSDANIGTSVPGIESLSDYADVEAFVLGYAHKFSDQFSLLGSYTHQTGRAGLYSPVNDRDGIAFLARYTVNAFRVDAGVLYYDLENSETTIETTAGDVDLAFKGNDAIAYSLRLGYSF